MSPISSRNSVPPSASSNRPRLAATAPVKAPRAWPNSSDSSSDSVSAVQLTGTNGARPRASSASGWRAPPAPCRCPIRPPPAPSRVAGRHARHQLVDLEHARALALDLGQARSRPRRGPPRVLRRQPLALERARHGQAQLLDVERLRDVVVGALARWPPSRPVTSPNAVIRMTGVSGACSVNARSTVEAVRRDPCARPRPPDRSGRAAGALDGDRAVVDRVDLEALAAQDLAAAGRARPRRPRPPAPGSCSAPPAAARQRARPRLAARGRPAQGQAHGEGRALARARSRPRCARRAPPTSSRQIARPRPVPLPRPLVV